MASPGFRKLGYVLLGVVLAVGVGVGVFLFLTRTETGSERLRRLVVSQLERRIRGRLEIGRIAPGPLLTSATLHDVRIQSEAGRPFLTIDSVRAEYDIGTLLSGSIVIGPITLYGPTIEIERLPGAESWNYEEVFPGSDEPGEPRLVLLEDVTVIDGTVILRSPLELEPPVEPDDTSRLITERVPGGLARVMRFESVNAELPRVLWESPDEPGSLIEIASLSTRGFIWEDPFELQALRGTVALRDSVLTFDAPEVVLPGSRAAGLGEIVLGDETTGLDIRIEGEDVAFDDLRWLYPPFPEEGGGTFTLRIESVPDGTLWLATDARLSAPGTELEGSLGVVTGDTLYFTNVSLRASPLDVELLDSILPVDLPVEGLLVGTVEVDGPLSMLDVRGDLTLASEAHGPARAALSWQSVLNVRPVLDGGSVDVRRLSVDIDRLELALLEAFGIDSEALAGSVSGRVQAAGRLDRELAFTGVLEHSAAGVRSMRASVDGRWRGDAPGSEDGVARRLAATVEIEALDLDSAALAIPGLEKLRGTLRGPVHIAGDGLRFVVDGAIETSGGPLTLQGRFDLSGPEPSYDLVAGAEALRLDEFVEGAPDSEISGRVHLLGAGTRAASAEAFADVYLDSARVQQVHIPQGTLTLTIRSGVARIDTLLIAGPVLRVEASGALGLVEDQAATVRFVVESDSVGALGLLLRGEVPDAEMVAAGEAPGGSLRLAGEITGNLGDFELRGEGTAAHISWDVLGADTADIRISGRRTAGAGLAWEIQVEGSDLRFYQHRLSAARAEARYTGASADDAQPDVAGAPGGNGGVRIEAYAPGDERYVLDARFRTSAEVTEIEVGELVIDVGAAPWTLAAPARMRLTGGDLLIDGVELARGDAGGRILALGRVPYRWEADPESDPVDLEIEFSGINLPYLLRVIDPEIDGDGVMAGRFRARGTSRSPAFSGRLAIDRFRHGDVRLDRVDAQLDYAARILEARIAAATDGRTVLTGAGRIPVDLALEPVEQRRLDQPLDFRIHADRMPAALVASLVEGFSRVEGEVNGSLTISGTTLAPRTSGEATLRGGAAYWAPLNVRYRDVDGTFRFIGDREVMVDVAARADVGRATMRGTISFARAWNDPSFDLTINASEFQASRRRDVDAIVTGQAHLGGSFTAPVVNADVRVNRGTLNLDEIWRQYQIVELDLPSLFGVSDSLLATRDLPTNPFLRNLVFQANMSVDRDSWLRSREVNVEVSGNLAIEFDRLRRDLRLTGSLQAVRGSYLLLGRRFVVREGTVDFVGTPGIDPNLDITTTYRARTARGDPLDIYAVVSGTLQSPRVSLTSDVQPPMSESDLISYLLFGRPTYALAESQSRAVNRVGEVGMGLVGGLVGPAVWGFASSGLETFAQNVGLDYLSITAGQTMPGQGGAETGIGGFLEGTQVEVGRYLSEISPNLFLAVSQRIGTSGGYGRGAGARVEWRFRPTWTAELFVEDRFARTPSFGLDQALELRKVYGFTIFREWGFRGFRSRPYRQEDEDDAATGEPASDPPQGAGSEPGADEVPEP